MTTPSITAIWNKDLTITLRACGKKIFRTKIESLTEHQDQAQNFINGWFGTEDKTQQKVNWSYS